MVKNALKPLNPLTKSLKKSLYLKLLGKTQTDILQGKLCYMYYT